MTTRIAIAAGVATATQMPMRTTDAVRQNDRRAARFVDIVGLRFGRGPDFQYIAYIERLGGNARRKEECSAKRSESDRDQGGAKASS